MNPMHHGITTTGASQFAVGVGEEARVEVGTLRGVYQNFAQAELSIARWIEEYNHDRPHRGIHGQTPHMLVLGWLKPLLQTWPHVSSLKGYWRGVGTEGTGV